jgi:tetratricopeptide (TPR) repeat protein
MRGLPAAVRFLSALLLAATLTGQAARQQSYTVATRTVSSTNLEAVRAFDEGLTLLYAFNPGEARRRFLNALALDQGFALARWGTAMTYGVNINTSYDPAAQRQGHQEIVKAQALEATALPVERALIDAAAVRFARMGKSDGDASAAAYAGAMRGVAQRFPDDDDVAALTAEAEMDTMPWDYWKPDGKPSSPIVPDIVARLETVLARNPRHIQAEHLLIHALEESPHPERSIAAADALMGANFEPGAEHLAHMPAHAYMRVGDYHDAGLANTHAIDLFDTYLAGIHAPGHDGYRGHDCGFAVDAYIMSGEEAAAKREAQRCDASAPVLAARVAIRFHGDLHSLEGADSVPFAQGMASVATSKFASAENDAKALDKDDDGSAKIAAAVLRATIARAHGDRPGEIAALERAVKLQDDDGYSEPPTFYYPVRESLGGALLRAGRAADAERVLRACLVKNPLDPRALFGLAEALERQGHSDEAARVRDTFREAWKHADAPLTVDAL